MARCLISSLLSRGSPTAQAITLHGVGRWEEANMSYYGRAANYDYKNKYMIEGQFRYDGSSSSVQTTAGLSSGEHRSAGESPKKRS